MRARDGLFRPHRLPGYIARDTGIAAATGGVAFVVVVRKGQGAPVWTRHGTDILFGFVMSGEVTLEGEGKPPCRLSRGDACVIPPGLATRLADPSADLEILEVALPGAVPTAAVPAPA